MNGPAEIVVPEPHIECELRRHFHVILNKNTIVMFAHNCGGISHIAQSGIWQSEQVRRHSLSGISDVLGIGSRIFREVKVASKEAIIEVAHLAKVPAGLHQMPSRDSA